MATRQKGTVAQASEQELMAEVRDWRLEQPEQADEQTEVDRVSALLHDVGGTARASVKVHKVERGESTYCQEYECSEFEAGGYDMIRDAYGPGRYKIYLYGTNEAGNFGIMARTNITLAEMRGGPRKENPIPVNDGLAQVVAMLADGQTRMLEALTALRAPSQSAARDPMEEMGKMLAMMKTMRDAMGLDVPQQPKSGISDIIAAVRELRGVAEELTPEKSEPDSLVSMLPQALELIRAGMAQQQTAPAQAMPAVTMPESMQPTNPTENEMNLFQLATLKSRTAELVKMSNENKTAQQGAEYIRDNLPAESVDDFLDLLDDDNWINMLAVLSPEVLKHQEWLGQVRTLVLDMFPVEDELGNLAAP